MDHATDCGTTLAWHVLVKSVSEHESTGSPSLNHDIKNIIRRHLAWLGLIIVVSGLLGLPHHEVTAQTLDSGAAPPAEKDWAFDIVPYLWLASYDGTFGLPSAPPGTSGIRTDSGFATHISAAAMLSAQIRYRDVGLFLDGAWLQLKTEGGDPSGLYSGVGSDLTWCVFGGVGYRFTDWFSTTVGYRYLHVDYAKDNFQMNANVQGFLLGLGFHF